MEAAGLRNLSIRLGLCPPGAASGTAAWHVHAAYQSCGLAAALDALNGTCRRTQARKIREGVQEAIIPSKKA
jgi:hypothetical protein